MESISEANEPTIRALADSVQRTGPILFYHGWQDGHLRLAALLVRPDAEEPPTLYADGESTSPQILQRRDGLAVLSYRFTLPAHAGAVYSVDGADYAVAGDLGGDLRIAYVACNGQEDGDRDRPADERNALWRRLAEQHDTNPIHLLLQGGDQLYADEILKVDPALQAWSANKLEEIDPATDASAVLERMRSYLLERYVELYNQPAPARLMARVPSMCMWDDHDICDGWGSLEEEQLDSVFGRALFTAAREYFLIFQLGVHPDEPPPICPDRTGATLSWGARLPGVSLLAPDLRSERRPDRVMADAGYAAFGKTLEDAREERVLVLSSVPALGPRLSWVEAGMQLAPGVQKYEDDLRDQWQSRAHRDEWREFLRRLLEVHGRNGSRVTLLSGEIHLATRGTMDASSGPMHQLVASGITHPPPPEAYARCLGALARLGESPLPQHPIRLYPLPGQKAIYTAQRNYLMLERNDGAWRTWWELEHDGATPALSLEE